MTRSSPWIAHLPFAVALVLAFAACGGEDLASAPAAPVPRIETTACEFTVPEGWDPATASCGRLIVSENRAQPSGRTVRIAFAVFKAAGPQPTTDPFVFLSGGPGVSALDYLEAGSLNFLAPFGVSRDLVFFDQRGTGLSRPSLDCPERRAVRIGRLAGEQTVEEVAAQDLEVVRACHDRLVSEGIDLAAYTSAASALDLHDLMMTLGYRQWNVFGWSYGTRLALTAMRDAADGIRSAILMSAVPVQWQYEAHWAASLQRSLDTLFASCAADAACNASYPDLEGKFFQVVNQLNQKPVTLHPVDPGTGKEFTVVMTGDRYLEATQAALFDNTLIPFVPAVVKATLEGNYGLLAQAGRLLVPWTDSDGVLFSVSCGESTPFVTPEIVEKANEGVREDIKRVGLTRVTQFTLDVCKFWGAKVPAPIENQPVSSDIPTLVLAGEYDPITPPDNGRLVAETLSQHYFYEFPGFGHKIYGLCWTDLVNAFLADPLRQPDSSCVDALPPLKFVLPAT